MFYSHTFLARKGPLGTVWCAAHLQHRLKKSHITSVDIFKTIECIKYPDVPIALRMSGHLLVGVARIYSKKVDYLYQDSNIILISIRKAFTSVEVNLPEDATHAPFDSVTLPDNFELDAVDLDIDSFDVGNHDYNLKRPEEITLSCDQIPTGKDPYISVTLDEDILRNLSHSDDAFGLRPMEEDAPSGTVDHSIGSRNPSPGPMGDSFPENLPEAEILRHVVHDNVPQFPDAVSDRLEPDIYLAEQLSNEKETTRIAEETAVDEEVTFPPQNFGEAVNSPVANYVADVSGIDFSHGHASINLDLNPTPQADEPKEKRRRKKKQRCDEDLVLTNKVMKAALENCNDIKRRRKCCPSSDLDAWKSSNKLRKENIFFEPLISGMSANLHTIYDKDFISSKPHLHPEEEAHEQPTVAVSSPVRETILPLSSQVHDQTSDHHVEIENRMNYEGPVDTVSINEIMGSPSCFRSPVGGDDFTPAPSSNLGSSLLGTTTIGTASTGTLGSVTDTPMTIMEEGLGFENTGLPTIHEDMGSAEVDELNFLDSEDYTPMNFQRSEGFNSLSGTTRKVAQFLKEKYSPITEDLNGNLSLNKLLEGKTRKVCARMLFETLVLKCGELIDVQQEEAYGDIALKLTPKLFKDQI